MRRMSEWTLHDGGFVRKEEQQTGRMEAAISVEGKGQAW